LLKQEHYALSIIYSVSIPSTPYIINEKVLDPEFNKLPFEDFCEFGLGMAQGDKKTMVSTKRI